MSASMRSNCARVPSTSPNCRARVSVRLYTAISSGLLLDAAAPVDTLRFVLGH